MADWSVVVDTVADHSAAVEELRTDTVVVDRMVLEVL